MTAQENEQAKKMLTEFTQWEHSKFNKGETVNAASAWFACQHAANKIEAELRAEIAAKDAEVGWLREQVMKLRIALSGALGMHDGHTVNDEKVVHEMACITLIETSPEITQ